MRIALFGGAFNPPHLGHILVAQQVLDFGGVDELWFVPTFQGSFDKPVASVEDRLAMVKLIDLPKTKVCTLEIDHQLDGHTINLLPLLPKDNSYVFIIGSDNLPSFHLWGNWQDLVKQIPFIVFPRLGFASEPLYENMTVLNHEHLILSNISSTKIRARIKEGLSLTNLIPSKIEEHLANNKLYKLSPMRR